MTSLAHCDVTKKLSHAQAGINRSQTPGACLVHPGVRDIYVPVDRLALICDVIVVFCLNVMEKHSYSETSAQC